MGDRFWEGLRKSRQGCLLETVSEVVSQTEREARDVLLSEFEVLVSRIDHGSDLEGKVSTLVDELPPELAGLPPALVGRIRPQHDEHTDNGTQDLHVGDLDIQGPIELEHDELRDAQVEKEYGPAGQEAQKNAGVDER